MEKRFNSWKPPEIENGKLTKWNWLVQFTENLTLGKMTDIGAFTYINARYGVEIGDNVQVGSHCSIYSESTIDQKQGTVILKRNALIGTHSTIMPGVTIGENAIIGAYSFVNKDIPSNAVAYGVPAKVVKINSSLKSNKNKIVSSPLVEKSVEKWNVPLFKVYFDQDDVDAATSVIKRGTYWTTGPEIEQFEKKIAELTDTKYALSFNSGTSALQVMLEAFDVKGKEVIIPSFTFIATANAVLLAGGIPVFAESEGETFGLDYNDVCSKITDNTVAIMPVHFGGCVVRDMEKIRKLCDERGIYLLDDGAESLGAKIKCRKLGSFSDATMFSLCQNKVITSGGEGGLVVTNSKEIYEKMKLLRSHGRVENENEDYFFTINDSDYLTPGYNFRMSSISAAIGLSQLKKISLVSHKRAVHSHYLTTELKKIPEITCPAPPTEFSHLYQMYTILIDTEDLRNRLQQYLSNNGIMSKVYFTPVHLFTLFRHRFGFTNGDLPQTEMLSKKVLTLPMAANFTRDDMVFVVSIIKSFFRKENLKKGD